MAFSHCSTVIELTHLSRVDSVILMATSRKHLPSLVLIAATLALAGCFLAGSDPHPKTLTVPLDGSSAEYFQPDPLSPNVYRSKDGVYMTALSECPVQKSSSPVTRTRELFVGFKEVRMLHSTSLSLSNETVEKTILSASLDKNPLTAIVYSTHRKKCAFDIVLWQPNGSDDAALASAATMLETNLNFVVSSIGA